MTGATCEAGNARSFRNSLFHSLLGVHEVTHLLYIYIHLILNLSVLELYLYINN